MKFKSSLLFPIFLLGSITIGIASEMMRGPVVSSPLLGEPTASPDTVVYPKDNYKSRRVGSFEAITIADSLLGGPDSLIFGELDTTKRLSAKDTLIAPDSLREIDPFRFKYYVALLDSLTHREVSDSLRASGDSLMLAEAFKLDSLYAVDSAARAKIAFEKWYASLSKEERKKYDFEQKELRKKAISDSLQFIKEEEKAIKDSITKNTPRILDTYALADSMQYKRIISWTEDRDFNQLDVFIPDTSYNYHFYDYDFLRKDVNATWLGVAGSPIQYYNFFNRAEAKTTGFWESYSPWSYTPQTFRQYNTKTPHTELAYFGTLMAGDDKESDNIHFLTTQNITPAFNFSILYEKWGGGGMLTNEKTSNGTLGLGANYLGKKYLLNAGLIKNTITMGENGGLTDLSEIRDTTIDPREVKVAMSSASSATNKMTFYADQQLRIPFNFINELRKSKDSTYVASDDVTTAFVGHALEYSKYGRRFDESKTASDSLGREVFDNKLYIRLQPWSSESFISKLDVGVGDEFNKYHYVTASDTSAINENSLYTYAGASGKIGDRFEWNAKSHYTLIGANTGDFDINAGFKTKFYPFRKAKKSPMEIKGEFISSHLLPEFYQRHFYSTINELLRWDYNLKKVSTTKLRGSIDIPHWRLHIDGSYALLNNYTYYDTNGVLQQYDQNISVLSANLRHEIILWNTLHLDTRILAQYSSNQDILPLPSVALNLKYFIQFPVEPGVMEMQIGVNGWANTEWYSPQWNYITGVFSNQKEWKYTNGPFFDVFVNMQWKTCCIFIKVQNIGNGWPMDHADYFSAHRHIITTGLMPSLKFGIFWPFYISPVINRPANK